MYHVVSSAETRSAEMASHSVWRLGGEGVKFFAAFLAKVPIQNPSNSKAGGALFATGRRPSRFPRIRANWHIWEKTGGHERAR